jgi:hypothetical protein
MSIFVYGGVGGKIRVLFVFLQSIYAICRKIKREFFEKRFWFDLRIIKILKVFVNILKNKKYVYKD